MSTRTLKVGPRSACMNPNQTDASFRKPRLRLTRRATPTLKTGTVQLLLWMHLPCQHWLWQLSLNHMLISDLTLLDLFTSHAQKRKSIRIVRTSRRHWDNGAKVFSYSRIRVPSAAFVLASSGTRAPSGLRLTAVACCAICVILDVSRNMC